MRPLPADHSSRAFTLFYIVFGLLVGGWHFASRYFHDLNLLSYQTLINIIFTRMDKAKKKAKKVTKKVATPTFSADINLDQEEPDIPEKVQKIEVDQISIVKKVEGKGDVQPLVVVKEERVQPFVIEEKQDISTVKSEKDGDGKVDQQVRVPIGLVQDIIRQDQVKPIIQEHPLQQQRKEQQDIHPQPSEEIISHTFQPAHLASTTMEEKVETHPRQQPIQIQKKTEVKKIELEDDEQDQLALSLKEDSKSKAKTTKKTTKKSKTKPKAATSAIFAVQDIVDLDEFNDVQEVKPKSQIIAHVEQKRQEIIKEIIEVKQPQIAKEQQEKPAEPEIITSKVSEEIAEAQFKQQPLEQVQLKNTTDPIEQQKKSASAIMQQDKYPQNIEHIEHIEEPQVFRKQIAVKQQTKVEVKEEIIPVRNIEQEVQSQIAFTFQDNKHKSKITKKNTKKVTKKPKVDKNKQLTDNNIFDVKEIQQNELLKPAQVIPQPHIPVVEKAQELKEQQKIEEDIGVIEQKQKQKVPVFVQAEKKHEQGAQQLPQVKEKQEIQQTKVQIPIQEQRVEPEPTFTQQPVIIAQKKPIIEQPAPEPTKQEAPVVKKEVEEEQEIQALSFADPLKPKTNKTTKKTTKKPKTKPKEEKNAVIGESMLSFDLEVVKNEQPQKQEEKIEKAEEIPSKPIEIAKNVQQQVKPQANEQIVQEQPPHKIVELPLVVPEKNFTKSIEKPQKPQPSPPVSSSAPESKKEIVSQLISMIRFHNDQEIKTMRERMQMLQEDILSRMSRSKPSSSIRAPSKKPDYQWIIQENISLHGQYKSLNKH